MGAQVEASLLPGLKVVGHGDGSASGPLIDAVGDVLPESGGALNGRLVHLLVLPDLVRASVALEGAQLLALGGSLAVGCVFLHVVLDEGVPRPPVDRDEDGARSLCGASGEGNVSVGRVIRRKA